jgi:hypothetical protein
MAEYTVHMIKDSFEQKLAQLLVDLRREDLENDHRTRWAVWLLITSGRTVYRKPIMNDCDPQPEDRPFGECIECDAAIDADGRCLCDDE